MGLVTKDAKFSEKITTPYEKGLDHQRELFKMAKFENDYDNMCDALENIKSEIKIKIEAKGNSEQTRRVEEIIKWYRTKEAKCSKMTSEGPIIQFPPDMTYKVNRNLTIAYEILIKQLDILGLI